MSFQPDLWTRFEFHGIPIYIRSDRPDWLVPNDRGDAILQACAHGGPVDMADPLVRRFLHRLPDGPALSYAGRAEFLQTEHLRELWFHITNRCNQACRHCLFASSPRGKEDLPAARIRDIARQAARLGCRVFALTGGEPLVHPQFPAVVDSLLEHEAAHVVVLTNGVLLRDYAGALSRWPAARFHLQVSVDGLGRSHDQIRGRGAFAALVANLEWLKARRIPFTLSMCVHAGNLEDMPGLVDWAARLGAANLHFLWYFIRGRAAASRFAPPEKIFPYLAAAYERALSAGIAIDNLEALRGQVFAPPATIHDGAGSGWESLAVGPDGRLYPSPALVGVEALGTAVHPDLEQAWRRSPILEELRRTTAASLSSPLRFLLGGGDPDHSYLHGGTFVGRDPYYGLYEQAALWLIAREAAGQPVNGPPRLRLKMGDVLESCGAHGAVALTHTNCLLAAAMPDSRAAIRDFYQDAAQDNKAHILNPACYPEESVAHIPPAARGRSYGCGSPVLDADLRPGEGVLDLGCGTGVECFIAARLVGDKGRVIGVDMLDAMLAHAARGAVGVAANLGYGNLDFRKGFLEDLPVTANSLDVVLSNCVINLSSHKRRTFAEIFRVLRAGGRLVIADVVCDTEPDAAIRNDATLRGECIAGALTQRDLFGLLEESGFVAPYILKRFPYRLVRGHPFFSLTFTAHKPAATGTVRVMYRGPFPALVTGKGTMLPVGAAREIAGEEIPGGTEDLFILDGAGAATNMPLAASGCCPPVGLGCCSLLPPAAAASVCPPVMEPPLEVVPETQGEELAPGKLPKTSDLGLATRHRTGCMVCGGSIRYMPQETACRCHYCQEMLRAAAVCEQGHFVCDACHTADALALMEHICLTTRETDMIALLKEIRRHPAISLHGPEHHALVPGVILAAYGNAGGTITPDMVRTALRRGPAVPGGSCAFMGICGAVTGVGIAFSLLLEANPVKPRQRRQVQQVVQAVLQEGAALEAARCCQRECWLALKKAAALSRDLLPIPLSANDPLICRQAQHNQECLGVACPLFVR